MSRTKLAAGSLLGAVAIHLAFLACSVDSRPDRDGGSTLDVVADVVRDAMGAVADSEVRDAAAQDAGPVTMEAPCAPAGQLAYAVFQVPSVRSSDVPRVTAVTCRFAAGTTVPPGFALDRTCGSAGWAYTDGQVAVFCGSATAYAAVARIRLE